MWFVSRLNMFWRKMNINSSITIGTKKKYISTEGRVTWESPSNIALVKYWGKWGRQMPRNPSLSFSLKNSVTRTLVDYRLRNSGEKGMNFRFDGERQSGFEKRISGFLHEMEDFFPFLKEYHLNVSSDNTFPHSSGVASSASAYSALALCLCSLQEEIYGEQMEQSEFFRKASYVARLGSGSAARSVYGGFVGWGKNGADSAGSDEYALPIGQPVHEVFRDLQDAILLMSTEPKKVTSSRGHALMENHPYAEVRYQQAHRHYEQLCDVLTSGDLMRFADLVENEAMSLHALMMNSHPSYTLLLPNTLAGIERIRNFRIRTGIPVCFTLDAGPNIHLLYPKLEQVAVVSFIEEELKDLLEQGNWLADEVGDGPVKLDSL